MNTNNFEILSPFEPPHLDAVTGLAIVKNKLISGSKDKHLRLWSLDHTINNSKHTMHIFNDYVNAVHSTYQKIKVRRTTLSCMQDRRMAKSRFAILEMKNWRYWGASSLIPSPSTLYALWMKILTD